MPNLFDTCVFSNSGINKLKLIIQDIDGDPIDYPIDYNIKNSDDSIITGELSESASTVTFNSEIYPYYELYPYNSFIEEEETKDRQGVFFTINGNIKIPKVDLDSNIEIVDYFFSKTQLGNSTLIFTDDNGNEWIIGYNQPLTVDNLVININDDNYYDINLVSKGYNRIRLFERV